MSKQLRKHYESSGGRGDCEAVQSNSERVTYWYTHRLQDMLVLLVRDLETIERLWMNGLLSEQNR